MKNILHIIIINYAKHYWILSHNFSHFLNSCYSIMVGTYAIEQRPQILILLKKDSSLMFYEFDTIKHNKNFVKYGV